MPSDLTQPHPRRPWARSWRSHITSPSDLPYMPAESPPARPSTTMASALDTFMSYLKLPVLASSGIAAVLSGLLYFKQK
jgi:hypothetical protein